MAAADARHLDGEVATLLGQATELAERLATAEAERDAVAEDAAELARLVHAMFEMRGWRGYAVVTRELVARHLPRPPARWR